MYCQKIGRFIPHRYARSFASKLQVFPQLENTLSKQDLELTNVKSKSQELIATLHNVNKICIDGGGEKGQLLHVKKNKKVLPRERLSLLFDDNSDTLEICTQAGLGLEYGDVPGATVISCIGEIHGKYCMVVANDATLKGGSFFPISVKKGLRAFEICEQTVLPSIYLVDSGGGFLPLQSEFFADKNHGGRNFYNEAIGSAGGLPQISLVCGSCTAGGAYVPTMSEDAAITDMIGTIFLGGPPLVKAATGEEVTAEELGGATLHCNISGCTDYFASTEYEGIEMVRDLIATLNILPEKETLKSAYENEANFNVLNDLCGKNTLSKEDMMGIIYHIVDDGRLRMFKSNYGKNLIAGYTLIDRQCVGLLSNFGPLTAQDALKGSHFIQICEHRQLPLIFLQNSGPLESIENFVNYLSEEEKGETLKCRGAMSAALACSTVPKVALNVAGCHGDDNYTLCGPSFSPNFLFWWPNASSLHSTNIQQGTPYEGKPITHPKSLFPFAVGSSLYWASRVLHDGVIIPSQTPQIIRKCLRIINQKDRHIYKHKQFPVFRF